MPITAIKRIQNFSSVSISVQGVDLPNNPAPSPLIAPGDEADVDMWIPWARSAQEFTDHHLTVNHGPRRPRSFVIWQFLQAGEGDFVRVSTDGAWHDPGIPIGGLANVGGDRHLVVYDDKVAMVEPGRHGITSIVRIDNGSTAALGVLAVDGNSPRQSFVLDPGESIDADIWVPWSPKGGDFDQHNIELSLNGASRWKIWQADRSSDGDNVRVTRDAAWHDPGDRIAGFSQVGGDRALVVLDSSVELISAQRRPKPSAGEGDETITLNSSGSRNHFNTTAGGHLGRDIVSVTNDAHDINDKVGVPLIVWLDTAEGTGPRTRINPKDTNAAFVGLPFDGNWFAEAADIDQTLLKTFVTLSVHWNHGPPVQPDTVSCVKRKSGDIIGIGGIDSQGVAWSRTEQEAIQEIKNGRILFVIGVSGKRTRVTVKKKDAGEYLSTMADNDKTNNLSKLRSCPE